MRIAAAEVPTAGDEVAENRPEREPSHVRAFFFRFPSSVLNEEAVS